MQPCVHLSIRCLNEFELIRKYQCRECGAVMRCTCDEKLGHRFFPHQLDCCVELRTKKRIPVTLGFQPNACRQCRGLPLQAHPKAESGRTSKIGRYYWRELKLQTLERFYAWNESGEAVGKSDAEKLEARKRIEGAVLEELKALHATSPKYMFKERSQADIVDKCQVEVINLKATYVGNAGRKSAAIREGTELYGVEEFAAQHFRRSGFNAIFTEGTPFHVLFGVYMWKLIQDPGDPRVRMVSFGDRHAYDQHLPSALIWTGLPEDFGATGYGRRRAKAIAKHLSAIIEDRAELHRLFDRWLAPSVVLRQYLWAHRQESIDTARMLIEIIPPLVLKNLLRYLVHNFWDRRSGWPDLLLYRGNEWFLVEVKSSGDKLSENQKRWIQDNHRYLHLPFKLVKVHKIFR